MSDAYVDRRGEQELRQSLSVTLIDAASEGSIEQFTQALNAFLDEREFLGENFFKRTIARALISAEQAQNTLAFNQLAPIAASIGLLSHN
jgi:hypothetical protein